jgi:hypothetical protein
VPEQLARQMDGALLAIGALSETLKAKVRSHENWDLMGWHAPQCWAETG